MNKRIFVFCLPFLLSVFHVFANSMEVHVRHCQFYAPGKGPYLETYLMIPGNQLTYSSTEDDKYRASVEVTMYFAQNDEVKAVEKYNLKSMMLDDSLFIQEGLIDQKRFLLEPGTYQFKATFQDVNNPELADEITDTVTVSSLNTKNVAISGIQMLESFEKAEDESVFHKNGYKMVPKVTSFYPESIDALHFYTEIYNTDEALGDKQYLLSYYLEDYRTGEIEKEYSGYKKMEPDQVKVLLKSMNIEDLETGNYNLVLEVVNQNKELLAKQSFFIQRSNPKKTSDYETGLEGQKIENSFVSNFGEEEVKYQLESMVPIANPRQTRQIYKLVRESDKQTMQRFMLDFWQNREPKDPYGAWFKYSKQVEEVNKHFETPKRHGFETDRGRIYLQYGPPNEIVSSPREPGGDPYEIWHYAHIENEGNAKFVFHNKDLVSNNYKLIHSTVNGEVRNENWQSEVYNKFPGDDSKMNNEGSSRDHYGKGADDFFDE